MRTTERISRSVHPCEQFVEQPFPFRCERRIVYPVLEFEGIGRQIVEFIGIEQIDDQFVSSVKDTTYRRERTKAVVVDFKPIEFHEDEIIGAVGRITHLGQ